MSPQQSLVLLLVGMISFMGMGMSLSSCGPCPFPNPQPFPRTFRALSKTRAISNGDTCFFGTARRAQARACLSTGVRVTVVLLTFRVLARGGGGGSFLPPPLAGGLGSMGSGGGGFKNGCNQHGTVGVYGRLCCSHELQWVVGSRGFQRLCRQVTPPPPPPPRCGRVFAFVWGKQTNATS